MKTSDSKTEDFECGVCHKHFEKRLEVHTQADNSERGWRYICCKCLGHKPLSCVKVRGYD